VLYTAKEVATLDLVSNGRVALGVGIGWNRDEMRHHGVDPTTRGAKIDEQIRALKEIWTNETAEFHGEFVDFSPSHSWPKPVQRPHPPILIGGTSRAALRRLRSLGDGWLAHAGVTVAEIRCAREWLADNGRPDVPISVWGAGRDKATLSGYTEAGVDNTDFMLPSLSESDALRELDQLAELAHDLET
jgi:probable F420-dependent oxidoreductase